VLKIQTAVVSNGSRRFFCGKNFTQRREAARNLLNLAALRLGDGNK